MLEDLDLASDVEVVRLGLQAPIDHLCAGCRERPGAVNNGVDVAKIFGDDVGIIERESAPLEAEFAGYCLRPARVAAGEDGRKAKFLRIFCN